MGIGQDVKSWDELDEKKEAEVKPEVTEVIENPCEGCAGCCKAAEEKKAE